jgi:nucleotide-binding universal stress UspA family protein
MGIHKMYTRILLPLDGSPLAEKALPHAFAHAESNKADLILLRVLEPIAETRNLPPRAVKKAEDMTRALALEYLESVAEKARERDIQVEVAIKEGRPHEEITQFAETSGVDLIVICTRGKSGRSRWLMGSVADRVTRGANLPVLLVRAASEDA